MKNSRTIRQSRGDAVRKAKENVRFHKLRDAATAGMSLVEVAAQAGMKPEGARHLLYRRLGSSAWPPA